MADEDVEQPDVELEQLRADAEAAGVKVDGRWGVDRLREEIAAAAGPLQHPTAPGYELQDGQWVYVGVPEPEPATAEPESEEAE